MSLDEPPQQLTYARPTISPRARPEMFSIVVSVLGSGFLILLGLVYAIGGGWGMLNNFVWTYVVMFGCGIGGLIAGGYFMAFTVRYLRHPEHREDESPKPSAIFTPIGPAEWHELRQRETRDL
jgi:hypothetical protein